MLKPPMRRWFPVLFIHSLLTHGFTVIFRPALAYALIAVDAPIWMLNVVAASFAMPALFLALPIGRLVDVLGERLVSIFGAALILSGTGLALWGYEDPWLILIACVLAGAGHLPSVLVDQSQVANFTPPHRLDAMYGYYGLSASVGQLLGPLLLALPGGTGTLPPLGPVFTASFIVAIALCVTSYLTLSSQDRSSSRPSEADLGAMHQVRTLLRTPGVARSLLVGAVPVAVLDISLVYWPMLGVERNYDVLFVSMILSLRAVASMGSRFFLGHLVARWGRPVMLMASLLGTGAAALIIAVPAPLWIITVSAMAFGFMLGIGQPLSMSWLAALTPDHNRGMSVSLRLAANRLSQIGAPLVLGGLVAAVGTWAVIAATGVISIGTTFFVKAPPHKDDSRR